MRRRQLNTHLAELATAVTTVANGVTEMNRRLDTVAHGLTEVTQRLDTTNKRLDTTNERLETLATVVEAGFRSLGLEVAALRLDLDKHIKAHDPGNNGHAQETP